MGGGGIISLHLLYQTQTSYNTVYHGSRGVGTTENSVG